MAIFAKILQEIDFDNKFIFEHPIAWDNSTALPIQSVIESGSQNDAAKDYISLIKAEFRDVLEEPIYAKDIDPKIRGPFGVCRIELKEGAKPMHRKFFRCSGEREEALNELIKKLISRGWIIPSKSEWASQAFVVPKPQANKR